MENFSKFLNFDYLRTLLSLEKRKFDFKYFFVLIKLLFYIDKRSYSAHLQKLYSENISNVDKDKRRVIYMNDWGPKAGLADRIKGALVIYSLSKRFHRPFYISWSRPFSILDYLTPVSFNWAIEDRNIYYSKSHCFPLIFNSMKRNQTSLHEYIKKIVIKILFKRKKELHAYSNYLLFNDNYSKLFHELFKPTEIVENELKKYSHIQNYYSYTFRFQKLLGDFDEKNGHELAIKDREPLIKKNLKELKKLLFELPEGYKALVTSDSFTFLERVKEIDERIFIIPGKIYHPSTFDSLNCNERNKYPFLKSFVDFFMIMRAKKVYRLKTGEMYSSGFPVLAALIGGKPFIPHYF